MFLGDTNDDESVNGQSNPAAIGTTVSSLVIGAGVLNALLPDGAFVSSTARAHTWLSLLDVVSYGGVTGLEPGYRAKLVMPTYAGGSQGTVANLLRVDFPTSDVLFRLLGGSAIG